MGSPPHGRGARPGPTRCEHPLGLTPAWAGSTKPFETENAMMEAHPRMGGEHFGPGNASTLPVGSPPHGRGALREAPGRPREAGLTPAWAGSTSSLLLSPIDPRAHPRMGGEHSAAASERL